jgi:hypothetical protein
MARKYSKSASKKVEKALHEEKRGKLKSGPGGKGGAVRSRKQAIAIGLSEARKAGAKVPKKKKSKKVLKHGGAEEKAGPEMVRPGDPQFQRA